MINTVFSADIHSKNEDILKLSKDKLYFSPTKFGAVDVKNYDKLHNDMIDSIKRDIKRELYENITPRYIYTDK